MSIFDDMHTDMVTIVKKDTGQRFEGVRCSVQEKQTFIDRSDILIETGDLLQRSMSNGGEETYEVVDPGFYEKFHGIDAHYQIKHRKLGLPEARQAVKSISYNITGDNARINNNSIDNSINSVVVRSEVTQKIQELRTEVEKCTTGTERSNALQIVEAVEEQFKSGAPSKPVLGALIQGLPTAGSIASIASLTLTLL